MRLVFLLHNREELAGIPWGEIAGTFVQALYVDASMAAYCMGVSFFCFVLAGLSGKQWPLKVNRYVTLFLVAVLSLLTMAELPLYDEWGHKLTYKALWFLQQPAEVFHTASWAQLITGILFSLLLFWLGKWLLRRMVPVPEIGPRPLWISSLLFLPAGLFLLATAARGGYREIPIQVSDAYFSQHRILNDASVNSGFHLLSNVIQNLEAKKPYAFMPPDTAEAILDRLYTVPKDTTIEVLTTQTPNVVLVVLEGWAADVVETLGGYPGVAPHFSALARSGIAFDSCYASGNLSDQGIGAIFSSFPAQPRTSIITLPTRYGRLPCVNTSFKRSGYTTSFLFGGQLSYGNIRSYIYYNGFDKIVEEKDFDRTIYRGRLGVHDGELFRRQLQELDHGKQPFFAALFTLSTHGPFDFPGPQPLDWGDKEQEYINSVHYADRVIDTFMTTARRQPWFDNTLFIFISDHHHNTPRNYSYFQPEYRRIPLIFYGNVIKPEFRGYRSGRICSQLDLAATLLHQLGKGEDAAAFTWSRNLFNPYEQESAFYTFDEGFGWIRPEGRLVWHVNQNRFEFERYRDAEGKERLFTEGKAYLQRVTEEFWKE